MENIDTKSKEYKEARKKGHLPLRQLFPLILAILECVIIIAGSITLFVFFPYSLFSVFFVDLICVIWIVNSNKNPDYKISWIFLVVFFPVIGVVVYLFFYNRTLSRRQTKKIRRLNQLVEKNNSLELKNIESISRDAYLQANCITNLSNSHLYQNTDIRFLNSGEKICETLINDLKNAKEFIFLNYFIIKKGYFWDAILEILKEKVKEGVEVRVMYDDFGCAFRLPGNYDKILAQHGIKCAVFNKVEWQPSNQTNNRNHRKIAIIDGKIAFTGGINIADEYINKFQFCGHWKDAGVRLEGEAVNEMTRLFLIDYCLSKREFNQDFKKYYRNHIFKNNGFCIPFGDGPRPIFEKRVAKTALINLLGVAKHYFYITAPYLILDNEMFSAIESAALRGVKIKIITPHIPDKKYEFVMTRSSYSRLLRVGVEIYEYEPGFIHAKTYVCDDLYSIIGSTNLNYRSLVHDFENDVWIYNDKSVIEMKKNFEETLSKCIKIKKPIKERLRAKIGKSLIYLFAPLF